MSVRILNLEIARLREKISHLKQSRNWYRHRYAGAVRYFHENGIQMPWFLHARSDDPPTWSDPTRHEDGERSLAAVQHAIFHDLVANEDRPPEAHRYSDEPATFSFITETFPSHCSCFGPTILDLPWQQTLLRGSMLVSRRSSTI
jgi:hypothetical protein